MRGTRPPSVCECERLVWPVVVESVPWIVRYREVVDHDDGSVPVREGHIDFLEQGQIILPVCVEVEGGGAWGQSSGDREPREPRPAVAPMQMSTAREAETGAGKPVVARCRFEGVNREVRSLREISGGRSAIRTSLDNGGELNSRTQLDEHLLSERRPVERPTPRATRAASSSPASRVAPRLAKPEAGCGRPQPAARSLKVPKSLVWPISV